MTSDNSSLQLNISLSKEHEKNAPKVKEAFGELNVKVEASLMRMSEENLAMQVVIFVTKTVAMNIAWELLKIGIKRIYEKFSKANVIIRDNESIIYSIHKDFTVDVIVVPEKQENYEHIKDFDDLKEHLKNKTKNQ